MWVMHGGHTVLANPSAIQLFGVVSEEQLLTHRDLGACALVPGNVPCDVIIGSAQVRLVRFQGTPDVQVFQAVAPGRPPYPQQVSILESLEREVLEALASIRPIYEVLDSVCRLAEFSTGGRAVCSLLEPHQEQLRIVSAPSNPALVGAIIPRRALESGAMELGQFVSVSGAEDVLAVPLNGPEGQIVGMLAMWVKSKSMPVDPQSLRLSASLGAVAFLRDLQLQRLRNKKERLEAISRSMPIGLYQFDNTGRWIFADERHAQMTRLTAEQCGGEGWLESVYPEDRELVREAWRAAQISNSQFSAEYRLANGSSWVMAQESAAPGEGRIGTITEITELKRALNAVAEGAERFETLANHIAPFCWMADPGGYVFWYSQRWYEYTGTTLEEMQGWGWRAVHHLDHVQRVVDKLSEHWVSGEIWEDTFPLRGKDGKYRWFLSRALPIRDASGKVTRWFGTNTDVTELRDLESALHRQNLALQRSNEDLSRFAAVASHDLQEPLRTISTNAQLVQRTSADKLDEKAAAQVERIIDSAARMTRLIRDLLAYAQASADIDQAVAMISLDRLVHGVVENLRESFDAQGATVWIQPLPEVCAVDAHIAQVFQNLLSNALKYRRDGVTPRVQISATREGAKWRIFVQDNGQGFNPDHSQRIFDFLQRLHGNDVPGSGIGLAICKTIIERNGGEIGAEGRPGEGATFWLTLPASCGQVVFAYT